MKKWIIGVVPAVLVAFGAFALGETPVQQSAQHADSCTIVSQTNAVNTVTTLTIPAGTGVNNYIYVCEVDLNVSNNATGAVVSTNLVWTSTNLNGWQYKFSAVNAANTNGLDKSFAYAPGCIKSATPGTAVTIVSPAVNAQAAYTAQACFYYAS